MSCTIVGGGTGYNSWAEPAVVKHLLLVQWCWSVLQLLLMCRDEGHGSKVWLESGDLVFVGTGSGSVQAAVAGLIECGGSDGWLGESRWSFLCSSSALWANMMLTFLWWASASSLSFSCRRKETHEQHLMTNFRCCCSTMAPTFMTLMFCDD